MQHVQFVYQREFNSETADTHPRVPKYIKKETKYRPNFDQAYADELIKKFGLPTNKRPHKLSKGMQSVLSVIIGLASRAQSPYSMKHTLEWMRQPVIYSTKKS